MAGKTKPQANTVTLDRGDLKQLADFYRGIEAADAHFHACQDKSFRDYARGCLAAPNVQAAYKRAAELLGEDA